MFVRGDPIDGFGLHQLYQGLGIHLGPDVVHRVGEGDAGDPGECFRAGSQKVGGTLSSEAVSDDRHRAGVHREKLVPDVLGVMEGGVAPTNGFRRLRSLVLGVLPDLIRSRQPELLKGGFLWGHWQGRQRFVLVRIQHCHPPILPRAVLQVVKDRARPQSIVDAQRASPHPRPHCAHALDQHDNPGGRRKVRAQEDRDGGLPLCRVERAVPPLEPKFALHLAIQVFNDGLAQEIIVLLPQPRKGRAVGELHQPALLGILVPKVGYAGRSEGLGHSGHHLSILLFGGNFGEAACHPFLRHTS
eukprot:RCo008586